LPNRSELNGLRSRLAKERHLDPAIIRFLLDTPRTALPMDVLRTAVSALAFYDADEKNNDHEANVRKAIRLTSQIAMIVAAYDRIRKGKPVVEADRSISHSANFPAAIERCEALRHGRASSGYRSHPARGPRTERFHICGARDRGDFV
jgi:citrate synthase